MLRAVLQCEARMPAIYCEGHSLPRNGASTLYDASSAMRVLHLCTATYDDEDDELFSVSYLTSAFRILRETTARVVMHAAACAVETHDTDWLHVMLRAFSNLCDLSNVQHACTVLTKAVMFYAAHGYEDELELRLEDLLHVLSTRVWMGLNHHASALECIRACTCLQTHPPRIVRALHTYDVDDLQRSRDFRKSTRVLFLKVVVM